MGSPLYLSPAQGLERAILEVGFPQLQSEAWWDLVNNRPVASPIPGRLFTVIVRISRLVVHVNTGSKSGQSTHFDVPPIFSPVEQMPTIAQDTFFKMATMSPTDLQDVIWLFFYNLD